MSAPASTTGYELVWVNPSPTGPTERTRHDPQNYSVIRIPPGKTKTVSRTSVETTTVPVNDLGDTISFPGAKVVSREHARFEWQDGTLIIKDLGSTHGTFVSHRRAKFSDSDVIVETAPQASKKRVEGILALQDGDLIEFGRNCVRSDSTYHPVRCYLRLAGQPAPAPSIAPFARSGAFRVPDDVLDSDSDVVSIPGDVFKRNEIPVFITEAQRTPRIEAPVAPAAPATPAAPAPAAETPREIVDLTSDDEDQDPDSYDLTFDSDASEDERAADSDGSASDGHDDLNANLFDDTDSGSDIDDPFDFSTVPWRHEIDEVVREQADLQREALDARNQGDAYMARYKAQVPDSPATSVEADSPTLDAAKKRSVSPLAALPKLIGSVAEASAPSDAAVATTEPENTAQPKETEPLLSSPQKRKLDAEDTAEATGEAAQPVSATAATIGAPQTVDGPRGSGSFSSACTSLSPSPSKKMRLSNDKAQDDDDETRTGTTPSRARRIGAIAAKTFQVTSLLSAGFLAGSLFTFKSMMNAAAAANAAGYGK